MLRNATIIGSLVLHVLVFAVRTDHRLAVFDHGALFLQMIGKRADVDITEAGLQKFLYIKSVGDGAARQRGYGWASDWLCYLGGLSLERFSIVIETFGTSVVYLNRDSEGFLTDTEHAHALSILENIGTGQPEVIPSRYGKLDKLVKLRRRARGR